MNEKRYNTLNEFYRNMFNSKVFKVSLDAGFTCPNKDGKLGTGGCIFCTTTPFIGDKRKELSVQFEEVKTMLHRKWPDAKYVVYLEAGSNTYADVSTLKRIYEPLLEYENVVGLNIGTRPDCLDDDIIEYLEDLNKRTYLTVELGLQSAHDRTLQFLNRRHTRRDIVETVEKLKRRKIEVVIHIINGLPNETKDDMVETARFVSSLGVAGIKIHMLYIEKGSKLAAIYEKQKFPLLTKEEYIEIVARQLQVLSPNIVIHRITGDPDRDKLIAPTWLIKKFVVLNDIDKYLKLHDIRQGDSYGHSTG